jgi:hypothetical protein
MAGRGSASAAPPGAQTAGEGATLSSVADTVQTAAAQMRKEYLSMARQISIRFKQIADTNTGRCQQVDAQDSAEMQLPRAHKYLFDQLRRQKPDAYKEMAAVSEKFDEMDPGEQYEFLRKLVGEPA